MNAVVKNTGIVSKITSIFNSTKRSPQTVSHIPKASEPTGVTKSVLNRLLENLADIDPDSPRIVDWICFERQKHGLPTHSSVFDIPPKTDAVFEEIQETLGARYPIHFASHNLFRALLVDDINETLHFYIVFEKTRQGLYLSVFGDREECKDITEYFKNTYVEPNVIVMRELIGIGNSGPEESTVELMENEVVLAHDAFYPWLKDGIRALAEAFRDTDESTLLLIGEKGTGKSTFLRTLMFYIKKEVNATCSSEPLLMNPGFIKWLKDLGNDAFIAVEDADNLTKTRSDHQNHQMSAILNYTDGVVSTNSKLVISTNLPTLKDVDEALTRPGRCYRVLHFCRLTWEQANNARAAIKRDPLPEYGYKDGVETNLTNQMFTLAEALYYRNEAPALASTKPSFGFMSGKS